MTDPARIRPQDIAKLTEARLTFGPRGRAVDTATSLQFSLDHARARDAVLSEIDVPSIQGALTSAGLESQIVTSEAGTRDTFIKRPDLGRRLPKCGIEQLRNAGPVDVALVLADGLSATAVAINGPAFIFALSQRFAQRNLSFGKVIFAHQARVALGDAIANALGASTVVIAIGERPGLSASDSLGIYVTHHPSNATQDSERNCISNVREAGTPVFQAAMQTEELVLQMRKSGLSGVALSKAIASNALSGSDP
jgi:ethanolamine ammonia-lyase small subunit